MGVWLEAKVEEIHWRPGKVEVWVRRCGQQRTFTAPKAVVTLPVGVLKSPQAPRFVPELPQKPRALEGLEMGGDPFVLGTYGYVRVGAGEARAALGKPVEETLFFAGETTDTYGNSGMVAGGVGEWG